MDEDPWWYCHQDSFGFVGAVNNIFKFPWLILFMAVVVNPNPAEVFFAIIGLIVTAWLLGRK